MKMLMLGCYGTRVRHRAAQNTRRVVKDGASPDSLLGDIIVRESGRMHTLRDMGRRFEALHAAFEPSRNQFDGRRNPYAPASTVSSG